MKLFRLSALLIVSSLVFSACKYEKGPKISLRAKRDRAANEWFVAHLFVTTSDGKLRDMTHFVNTDKFTTIITMYRTGSYGTNMCLIDWKDAARAADTSRRNNSSDGTIIRSMQVANVNHEVPSKEIADYYSGIPEFIKQINNNGHWNFDKRHFKIQIHPELSYDANDVQGQRNPIDWTIRKLRQKEMMVWGVDKMNRRWEMTLRAVNKEDYWY